MRKAELEKNQSHLDHGRKQCQFHISLHSQWHRGNRKNISDRNDVTRAIRSKIVPLEFVAHTSLRAGPDLELHIHKSLVSLSFMHHPPLFSGGATCGQG